MTMSAAYLVSRDQVARFQARVSELDEETDDAELTCTDCHNGGIQK